MFALKKCFGFVPRSCQIQGLGFRRSSSLALVVPASKKKDIPEGISLEILDERHNISQIRQLIAQAFVENNEPIVNSLGELHYPSLSTAERIPLIEQRFELLLSDDALVSKVKEGLSLVAVKDNDPNKIVSVIFAERYNREIYKSECDTGDSFCETGLNLMRAVHEKAIPELQRCLPDAIAFCSHAATHPSYRSLGIVEHTTSALRPILKNAEIRVAFCITTAERITQYLIDHFEHRIIAEVFYNDYEENGGKIFQKLAKTEISAKALMAYVY